LTKQEQMVLCIVLGLLLTGWAVQAYRTAHPGAATKQGQVVSAATQTGASAPAASTGQEKH
jgi:hypothetical protein